MLFLIPLFLFHPKTGLPISGIKSVTVISGNAEFADAMATPIAVMGIKAGLYLIDQIPDLHCIIIDFVFLVFLNG